MFSIPSPFHLDSENYGFPLANFTGNRSVFNALRPAVSHMSLFVATSLHSCGSALNGNLFGLHWKEGGRRTVFGFFLYLFHCSKMSFVLSGHGVDFVAQFLFNMPPLSHFFSCFPHRLCPARKDREHPPATFILYMYVSIYLEEDSCEISYAAFVFECCAHLSAQWGNLFARHTHSHAHARRHKDSGDAG